MSHCKLSLWEGKIAVIHSHFHPPSILLIPHLPHPSHHCLQTKNEDFLTFFRLLPPYSSVHGSRYHNRTHDHDIRSDDNERSNITTANNDFEAWGIARTIKKENCHYRREVFQAHFFSKGIQIGGLCRSCCLWTQLSSRGFWIGWEKGSFHSYSPSIFRIYQARGHGILHQSEYRWKDIIQDKDV